MGNQETACDRCGAEPDRHTATGQRLSCRGSLPAPGSPSGSGLADDALAQFTDAAPVKGEQEGMF